MATFSKSKSTRAIPTPKRPSSTSFTKTKTSELNGGNIRPKSAERPTSRLAVSLDGNPKKSITLSSMDLGKVEAEYIRNLQQQIYFLELESNYLRDQASKAAELPTRVTHEADRMMRKLKQLQIDLDDKAKALALQETEVRQVEAEKMSAVHALKTTEENFAIEKKELLDEIVRLKKDLDRRQLENSRREVNVQEIKREADRGIGALQEAETKIHTLRNELEEKTDLYNKLRVAFEEKRAECLKFQTELQELEERYFQSDIKTKEEFSKELKEEIRQLRFDVREKEIQVEQERTLRNKISDDCAALVKENAALSSQTLELRKQIDLERQFKDEKESRRYANIQELVTLRENEKHQEKELEHLKNQLRIERQKFKSAMEKLNQDGKDLTREKLRGTRWRTELEELEGKHTSEQEENISLRRDKMMLVDQVTELQAKLEEKDEELDHARLELQEADIRCSNLESMARTQETMDSVKWEEFERMADTLKAFSQNMSPMRKSKVVEFDR